MYQIKDRWKEEAKNFKPAMPSHFYFNGVVIVITNVGRAHLLGFGSFEGVMATKAELYDYLVAHKGTIFRNADNPYLEKMLGSAGCQGRIINYTTGTMPTGTHLIGDYNAENVSAAICVGEHFGVSKEEALAAIRAYVPSNNRSQAMKTAHL